MSQIFWVWQIEGFFNVIWRRWMKRERVITRFTLILFSGQFVASFVFRVESVLLSDSLLLLFREFCSFEALVSFYSWVFSASVFSHCWICLLIELFSLLWSCVVLSEKEFVSFNGSALRRHELRGETQVLFHSWFKKKDVVGQEREEEGGRSEQSVTDPILTLVILVTYSHQESDKKILLLERRGLSFLTHLSF